jgi:hypothetical protein
MSLQVSGAHAILDRTNKNSASKKLKKSVSVCLSSTTILILIYKLLINERQYCIARSSPSDALPSQPFRVAAPTSTALTVATALKRQLVETALMAAPLPTQMPSAPIRVAST